MGSTTPLVTLVVAVAKNGVIGREGRLPWHIPDDLKRFKRLTLGKPCIMGRRTWDGLPRKPLPGRTNIIVSRDPRFSAEGAEHARSFEEALALARAENPVEIMVIGGQEIFAAALPLAGRIYLTEIAGDFAGDAFMPSIDREAWEEAGREGPLFEGALCYAFAVLERRQPR